jgi:hypothetical protein
MVHSSVHSSAHSSVHSSVHSGVHSSICHLQLTGLQLKRFESWKGEEGVEDPRYLVAGDIDLEAVWGVCEMQSVEVSFV